jgi:hypothetical protein
MPMMTNSVRNSTTQTLVWMSAWKIKGGDGPKNEWSVGWSEESEESEEDQPTN